MNRIHLTGFHPDLRTILSNHRDLGPSCAVIHGCRPFSLLSLAKHSHSFQRKLEAWRCQHEELGLNSHEDQG